MFAAEATDSAKETEHVLFFQPHAARDEQQGLFLANSVTVFYAKRKQNVCISSNTLVLIQKKRENVQIWTQEKEDYVKEKAWEIVRTSGVPSRKARLYRTVANEANLHFQQNPDYVELDTTKVTEKFRQYEKKWRALGLKEKVFSPLLLVLCPRSIPMLT